MFSLRVTQRILTRVPKVNASTKVVRDGVFREKTNKEAWMMDKGAWPCMSTFVLGIGFCCGFGTYYLASSPDVRLITGASRSRMFRGDLREVYVKEDVDICK